MKVHFIIPVLSFALALTWGCASKGGLDAAKVHEDVRKVSGSPSLTVWVQGLAKQDMQNLRVSCDLTEAGQHLILTPQASPQVQAIWAFGKRADGVEAMLYHVSTPVSAAKRLVVKDPKLVCKDAIDTMGWAWAMTHPPKLRVDLGDGTTLGQAPVWMHQTQVYEAGCRAPNVRKGTFVLQDSITALCMADGEAANAQKLEDKQDRHQAIWVYGILAALALTGAIVPFLVF